MYCNYCGKVIQDDASHCAYCGKRVGSSAARRRLMRPRADRKIAGVCAGVAEYFDLDVTLVRLVWLITAVMTGQSLTRSAVADETGFFNLLSMQPGVYDISTAAARLRKAGPGRGAAHFR